MKVSDFVEESIEEREPESSIAYVVKERNRDGNNSLVSELRKLVRNPLITEKEVALAYDLTAGAKVTEISEFPDDEVEATKELLHHLVIPRSTWNDNNECTVASAFLRRLDSLVCQRLIKFDGGIPPRDHERGTPPERASISLYHVEEGYLWKSKKWVALGYYLVRDSIRNVKGKVDIETEKYDKMFEAARAACFKLRTVPVEFAIRNLRRN